jgi:hypothetical protein
MGNPKKRTKREKIKWREKLEFSRYESHAYSCKLQLDESCRRMSRSLQLWPGVGKGPTSICAVP